MICFSKTMKSIFGTLELRSLNPFPFYLTSVVFSMDWKSRIMRQSKIAREVKFARIAHGWQFYIKVPGCWKWRACWKNRKVCGDLFFVIWIFADFKAETSKKNQPMLDVHVMWNAEIKVCAQNVIDKEVRSLNGNSGSLTFRVRSQILLVFTWRHQNSN